jgi:hypothetical protein
MRLSDSGTPPNREYFIGNSPCVCAPVPNRSLSPLFLARLLRLNSAASSVSYRQLEKIIIFTI